MKKIKFPIGVILAAGQGKRFRNKVKALLEIKHETFLKRIIKNFQKIGLPRIFVVLGYKAGAVKKYLKKCKLDKQIKIIFNPDYQKEQIYSLRLAVEKCPDEFAGIMFTPVDYPLVKLNTYKKLLTAWQENPQKICLPSYQYRKGHPAIFPRWAARKLLNENLSGGARDLLKNYSVKINYIIVNDPGILRDFDTYSDWKKYVSSF